MDLIQVSTTAEGTSVSLCTQPLTGSQAGPSLHSERNDTEVAPAPVNWADLLEPDYEIVLPGSTQNTTSRQTPQVTDDDTEEGAFIIVADKRRRRTNHKPEDEDVVVHVPIVDSPPAKTVKKDKFDDLRRCSVENAARVVQNTSLSTCKNFLPIAQIRRKDAQVELVYSKNRWWNIQHLGKKRRRTDLGLDINGDPSYVDEDLFCYELQPKDISVTCPACQIPERGKTFTLWSEKPLKRDKTVLQKARSQIRCAPAHHLCRYHDADLTNGLIAEINSLVTKIKLCSHRITSPSKQYRDALIPKITVGDNDVRHLEIDIRTTVISEIADVEKVIHRWRKFWHNNTSSHARVRHIKSAIASYGKVIIGPKYTRKYTNYLFTELVAKQTESLNVKDCSRLEDLFTTGEFATPDLSNFYAPNETPRATTRWIEDGPRVYQKTHLMGDDWYFDSTAFPHLNDVYVVAAGSRKQEGKTKKTKVEKERDDRADKRQWTTRIQHVGKFELEVLLTSFRDYPCYVYAAALAHEHGDDRKVRDQVEITATALQQRLGVAKLPSSMPVDEDNEVYQAFKLTLPNHPVWAIATIVGSKTVLVPLRPQDREIMSTDKCTTMFIYTKRDGGHVEMVHPKSRRDFANALVAGNKAMDAEPPVNREKAQALPPVPPRKPIKPARPTEVHNIPARSLFIGERSEILGVGTEQENATEFDEQIIDVDYDEMVFQPVTSPISEVGEVEIKRTTIPEPPRRSLMIDFTFGRGEEEISPQDLDAMANDEMTRTAFQNMNDYGVRNIDPSMLYDNGMSDAVIKPATVTYLLEKGVITSEARAWEVLMWLREYRSHRVQMSPEAAEFVYGDLPRRGMDLSARPFEVFKPLGFLEVRRRYVVYQSRRINARLKTSADAIIDSMQEFFKVRNIKAPQDLWRVVTRPSVMKQHTNCDLQTDRREDEEEDLNLTFQGWIDNERVIRHDYFTNYYAENYSSTFFRLQTRDVWSETKLFPINNPVPSTDDMRSASCRHAPLQHNNLSFGRTVTLYRRPRRIFKLTATDIVSLLFCDGGVYDPTRDDLECRWDANAVPVASSWWTYSTAQRVVAFLSSPIKVARWGVWLLTHQDLSGYYTSYDTGMVCTSLADDIRNRFHQCESIEVIQAYVTRQRAAFNLPAQIDWVLNSPVPQDLDNLRRRYPRSHEIITAVQDAEIIRRTCVYAHALLSQTPAKTNEVSLGL